MTERVVPRVTGLAYGGDWNPEQWPEALWPEDLALMREAGVTLVTVGVFSWALLEPEPDRYTFDWLDRVLDLTAEAGIGVDLATATASPPPWLGHRWPESLPVTAEGVRLSYGARQQYCPSSPVYRHRALALADRLVTRYADHPAVAMWHVGNEFGAHTAFCWCEVSALAFRDWLRERYDSLEELNRAWGTAFWSQAYSAWAEVIPPRRTPYFPNPTQQLDFRRFSSDALLRQFTAERDLIRSRSTADRPITTNFMRLFKDADYWRWADELDVISDDWYPDLADSQSPVEGALGADLMRSLGQGRPWLLMEQAVSAINWRPVNPPKPSGAYRLWSLQQVAHGADGILQFQWRAALGGAEKWHSGMLPHAGPRTRSWDEVVRLGRDLAALAPVAGARSTADVVVLLDWESWWALELDSRPSELLRQKERLLAWYQPLWEKGLAVDLAHPDHDLSGYRVVLAPQLYLVSDTGAASVVAAAEAGATVVLGCFSGAVDPDDRVRPGGYPAPFRDLLGLWVEEYAPLLPGAVEQLVGQGLPGGATTSLWTEAVHAVDTEVQVTYASGDLEGRPAVTRRRLPAGGAAWYVSCVPDPETLATVLTRAAAEAGVQPVADVAPGVEVTRRSTADIDVVFLLNHGATVARVVLSEGGTDLLSGAAVPAELEVPPGDVRIVAQPRRTPVEGVS